LALALVKPTLLLSLFGAFLFGDPLILCGALIVGIDGKRAVVIGDSAVKIAFVVMTDLAATLLHAQHSLDHLGLSQTASALGGPRREHVHL
jgi:hypothetical protein